MNNSQDYVGDNSVKRRGNGGCFFLRLSQDDSSTYIYSNSVMAEETTAQYLHIYATVKILLHTIK